MMGETGDTAQTNIEIEDDYAGDAGDENCQIDRTQGLKMTKVRFLLPSKVAGAIIGKSGSNITKLRNDFKANVLLPDCPGPERILSIVAENDVLRDLLTDIIPKFGEYSSFEQGNPKYEVRMLVHQDSTGCIIGKGGCQIKLLREKMDAKIKVYSDCCPCSTERVIQIYANLETILNCISEMITMIANAPIKIPAISYNPNDYDSIYANLYGGFRNGTHGTGEKNNSRWSLHIPRAAKRSPADLTNSPMRIPPLSSFANSLRSQSIARQYGYASPEVRTWTNGNSQFLNSSHTFWNSNNIDDNDDFIPTCGSDLRCPIESSINPLSTRFPFSQPPIDNNYDDNNFGCFSVTSRNMGDYVLRQPVQGLGLESELVSSLFKNTPIPIEDEQNGSLDITIPNEFAGAIIGKGGQRIRKIRRDSGANIKIDSHQQSNPCRIITVTGSLKQISLAKYLLQENVLQYYGR